MSKILKVTYNVFSCEILIVNLLILDENKVLSKVMEKITLEYEELKKAYEGMKCPKDDKIQALRSTARALETENELLLDEKKKIEIHTMNMRAMYEQKLGDLQKESSQSKDQLRQSLEEKKRLIDQSERMENEKLSLKQQLTKCEKDLDAAKKQIEKVKLGGNINILILFLVCSLLNF